MRHVRLCTGPLGNLLTLQDTNFLDMTLLTIPYHTIPETLNKHLVLFHVVPLQGRLTFFVVVNLNFVRS